jgi:ABC-type spermidine/putrescine transport system permease subunit II
MAMNAQIKIITLWSVFLLGTIFHTQLGLMPLFHGVSVARPDVHETGNLDAILWMMLAFFVIPMVAMVMTAFTDSRRYRIIHFGATVFYSVMNFLHVVLDLMVTPIAWYQIALMVVLLVVGLLLNLVAYQWMRDRHPTHRPWQEQARV